VAAEPTRRLMLTAAAAGSLGLAGTLAGCKGITALGPIPAIAPDVVMLEHAIAAEEAMVDRYAAARRQLGGTGSASTTRAASVIAAIGAEHEAHLRRLRAKLILPPRLAKTKIRASREPGPLPDELTGVLAALAADERAAVTRLTTGLLAAPAALAQLMASISASEAAHIVFLRRAGSA
jgi:hypothetical protein